MSTATPTPSKEAAAAAATATATPTKDAAAISAGAIPKVVYSSAKKRSANNYRLVPRLSIA